MIFISPFQTKEEKVLKIKNLLLSWSDAKVDAAYIVLTGDAWSRYRHFISNVVNNVSASKKNEMIIVT